MKVAQALNVDLAQIIDLSDRQLALRSINSLVSRRFRGTPSHVLPRSCRPSKAAPIETAARAESVICSEELRLLLAVECSPGVCSDVTSALLSLLLRTLSML